MSESDNKAPRKDRRPTSGKIKMHKYYKGIIALMKNREQANHYRRMITALYKEVGQFKAG